MSRQPKVTIGMPIYNGATFVGEALESILGQSFDDFEVIISDNASDDDTQAICSDYMRRDSRIRYDRLEKNLGATKNYNRLVGLARGTYFKWAAHDDNLAPEYLEKCVDVLDSDAETVLAFPRTRLMDADGKIVGRHESMMALPETAPHARLRRYLRVNFMRKQRLCNPVFGLVRLDALKKTRLIQDFVSSDRLLLAHLSLLGKFVEIDEHLFDRRLHSNNSTQANQSFAERMAWFNTAEKGKTQTRKFSNFFALRLTHLRDLFTAIDELVEEKNERRRCRRMLMGMLLSDPKWLYVDLKYTLGFRPSTEAMMTRMGYSRSA